MVELFTQDHGRIAAVARGVRKAKQGALGILQQFVPLLVSWSGNGELVTLSQVEPNGEAPILQGECLFAGIYLNELIMCLLQKHDPHPDLFRCYENAIHGLKVRPLQEKVLRAFEKTLLEALGYGVLPHAELTLTQLFSPEKFYRFTPEQGFTLSEVGEYSQGKANIFVGKHLISIANEHWEDEACLKDAKRLTRLVLASLLGARPLHSRKLFMTIDESL